VAPHRRDLAWEGCLNVRDLGGHRLAGGEETRYGSVVRADSIRQLTEAGWQAAVDYGIRTAIDLRGDHELRDDPPAELPIDVVNVPFMESSENERMETAHEVEQIVSTAPDETAATRDIYLAFLRHYRRNAAAALRAVARAPEGGVVVHCVGGKDRTGLLSAFLLHLAGVSVDDIAKDYALSEERLKPREQAWLAEAETEAERERILRISRTPAKSMAGVFEALEQQFGSVRGFLEDAGVSKADLDLAAARLR
jgi:protein-tyrosine phosphatase